MTTEAVDGTSLVRSSAVVALGTLLSRLTGLARIGLLAYAIGRGTLADTYGLANQTPNIVYELLLGGVLSATLVPVFVDHRRDDRGISAIFTVALTSLVALTALAIVAAPLIGRLYTMRTVDEAAQRDVAIALIRLFLPQMVFYGLTALATALLNAHRRFVAAAFAPVLNNVVVIATVLMFVRVTSGPRETWESVDRIRGDEGLILLLGLGTTAGIVAMALVLVPAIRRTGTRLRFVFDLRHPAVRRMVRLSGWTIGYVVTNQIALSVVIVLATASGGGLAAYQFAFIFFQLPHGLFAVSIMTTVMPELADRASAGDRAGFRERYAWGLRVLVTVVLPAVALFLVVADPLVGLMRFGAFDAHDVAVTADTLEAFALGLVAFSAYLYTLRGFYALQDTRTPFFVNAFENACNIVLALVLHPTLGVQGLALAYSISYALAACVAYALLQRRVGALDTSRTLATAGRVVVASAGLALVAWFAADRLWTGSPGSALVAVLTGGTAGLVVFVAAARGLGIGEVREITAAFGPRRAAA